MTALQMARLADLRADLFVELGELLALDDHCKHYEGAFSVHFPNYFEARAGEGNGWQITLDCYLVGPSRHYEWSGDTFGDALERCERDVRKWINESADARADEKARA